MVELTQCVLVNVAVGILTGNNFIYHIRHLPEHINLMMQVHRIYLVEDIADNIELHVVETRYRSHPLPQMMT